MNNNVLHIHARYTCRLRHSTVKACSDCFYPWAVLGTQMLSYQQRLQIRSAATWRESLGTFLRHRDCNPDQLVIHMPIAMLDGSLIGKNDMASPFRWKTAPRKTEKAFLGWKHNTVVELSPSIHKALVRSLYTIVRFSVAVPLSILYLGWSDRELFSSAHSLGAGVNLNTYAGILLNLDFMHSAMYDTLSMVYRCQIEHVCCLTIKQFAR